MKQIFDYNYIRNTCNDSFSLRYNSPSGRMIARCIDSNNKHLEFMATKMSMSNVDMRIKANDGSSVNVCDKNGRMTNEVCAKMIARISLNDYSTIQGDFKYLGMSK